MQTQMSGFNRVPRVPGAFIHLFGLYIACGLLAGVARSDQASQPSIQPGSQTRAVGEAPGAVTGQEAESGDKRVLRLPQSRPVDRLESGDEELPREETDTQGVGSITSVLIGAAISLVTSLLTAYVTVTHSQRLKTRTLAAALSAEIRSILDLAETRDYLGGMDQLIATSESTGIPESFVLVMRHNYFQVYQSNLSDIGMLPPDAAARVVQFYATCYSFLEDVAITPEESHAQAGPAADSLASMRESRAMLARAQTLGGECVELLRRLAGT